jgi:hypothetical protein
MSEELPQERTGDEAAQSVRAVIAIVVLFFAIANGVVAWLFADRPVNRGLWIVQEKWRRLRGLEQPVDWLIVGDSSCGFGLDPAIVEAELGGRAINLCTVGSMIALEGAWMLDVYLERFGAPRGVIVGHAYDVWTRSDQELRGSLWLVDPRASFWNGLVPSPDLDLEEALSLRVSPWLPLYSQPRSVEQLLVSRGSVLARPGFAMGPGGLTPAAGADPDFVRRDSAIHVAQASPALANVSAANEQALAAFTGHAQETGVPIYLVNAPLHDELYADAAFRRPYARLQERLAAWAGASAATTLLLREPMTFSAERMQNSDHVAGDAIREYSLRVAREVAAAQAAGAPR